MSEFTGEELGARVSVIVVDTGPGRGPKLHRHPYEEVFVVLEGEATFMLGDERRTVKGGEVVVAPAGQPHGFSNSGDGQVRMVNIHVNERFVTEWL